MKFDIRTDGETVQSFKKLASAEIWLELYQKDSPDKVFSIFKN